MSVKDNLQLKSKSKIIYIHLYKIQEQHTVYNVQFLQVLFVD